MKNKKRLSLDVYKFIAALMVVAIHIYPFSFINENVDYVFTRVIFRIAVPLFLMITGYYILPKALENKEILINYTKKIIKLYLLSILIYFPINIYNGYFKNTGIVTIIKDIFINGTFYHLWYFPALILGIWITYFLLKKLNFKTCIIIVISLYIIGLLGDSYFGIIKNIDVINSIYNGIFKVTDYTRNGLFFAPIFLFIGYIIQNKNYKIKTRNNCLFIIISLICLVIEGMILHMYKIPKHTSMYISLIPLSFMLFNLIISNYKGTNKKLKNLSTWIYILHPFFIIIVHFIAKILNWSILSNSLIEYILVVILTTSIILIIEKINKLFKTK